MSALDDVARMLVLVPWVRERPGASLQEAAEAFGVSVERISADLERLDFCGMPGLGGGHLFDVTRFGDRVTIDLADELDVPLRLTPREALALLLVGEAAAAALGDVLPALGSALGKLRDVVGVPADVSVTLADEGTRWLAPLRSAIDDDRQVRLSYRGRGDDAPQSRTLDPWTLRVERGEWYVQGRDHGAGELRTFRLDRIADLEVLTEARVTAAPDEALPAPAYAPSPGDTTYVVEVGSSARWLLDAVTPDRIEESDDDRVRVTFRSDAADWIDRLLLVAGPDAVVLEPVGTDAELRARARAVLANYR